MSDAGGKSCPDGLSGGGVHSGAGAGAGAGVGELWAWATFLACSWTWCIGMFLPVLLLRDYGPWGFAAFAAPNIVGAAALGWVISSQHRAQRLLETHRVAIGLFSAVTIAFHVYWLTWIGSWLPGVLGLDRKAVAVVLGVGLAVFTGLSLLRLRSLVIASVPMWLLSAALVGTLAGTDTISASAALPRQPEVSLIWLSPVMIFGFALCPYLDGTFLTARASLSIGRARFAFTVGFAVFFSAMITGTVLYSPLIESTLGGHAVSAWIGVFVLVHMLFQSAFTITAHRRASRLDSVPPLFLLGLLFVAALGAVTVSRLPDHSGLAAGEVGYRVFLGFYGLIFPAFVWLVMIPSRQSLRMRLRVFAGAAGIALPMFWMGFLEGHEVFLAPALLIVLASRLLLMRKSVTA